MLADKRVEFTVKESAQIWLQEYGYSPHYGARPLRRLIQSHILSPLSILSLEGQLVERARVIVSASSIDAENLTFDVVPPAFDAHHDDPNNPAVLPPPADSRKRDEDDAAEHAEEDDEDEQQRRQQQFRS